MNHRFWLGVVYVAIIGALSNIVAVFIDRDRIKEEKFPFSGLKIFVKTGRQKNLEKSIRVPKGKL